LQEDKIILKKQFSTPKDYFIFFLEKSKQKRARTSNLMGWLKARLN